MTEPTKVPRLARLALRIASILFTGRDYGKRLAWLQDAGIAVLHLATSFTDRFDKETREEIKQNLLNLDLKDLPDEILLSHKTTETWIQISKTILLAATQFIDTLAVAANPGETDSVESVSPPPAKKPSPGQKQLPL